jgi:hypothetical protein
MTKVKDLTPAKKQKQNESMGKTLVKDLLSKSISKGGKLKAIKVKVKFGGGGKSEKPKKKTVSHNPAAHKDV